MYFHMYFWMYFLAFKYSISLVPVGIPSIDLYFLISDYFCAHSHAIWVGWSVQVHFGCGLLKTSYFVHEFISVQFIPETTLKLSSKELNKIKKIGPGYSVWRLLGLSR